MSTASGAPRLARQHKGKQMQKNDRSTNNNNNKDNQSNHINSNHSHTSNKTQHNSNNTHNQHNMVNGKIETPTQKHQATPEQMRLAKMFNSDKQVEDPELKSKITQVCEVTGRSSDEVVVALHDCDYNTNRAINMLLEGDNDQSEWQESKVSKRKRGPTNNSTGSPKEDTSGGKNDGPKSGDRRDKSDKRERSESRNIDQHGGDGGRSDRPYSDRQRSSRGRQPPRLARGNHNNYRGREDGDRGSYNRNHDRGFGSGSERGRGRGRGGGRGGGRGSGRGGAQRGGRFGQRPGPEIDTWTNDAPSDQNKDSLHVSSWDEDWADEIQSKPADTSTAQSNSLNVTSDDWSEEWSGSLEESKVFTSSVTAAQPSQSETPSKSVNNSANLTADPATDDSTLYSMNTYSTTTTIQNSIDQTFSTSQSSFSQRLGLGILGQKSSLPNESPTEQPYSLSQYSREATESIKNAVGIGTSTTQESNQTPIVVDPSVISMSQPTQPPPTQQITASAAVRIKQPRSKMPPRSKIPASAVEMPRGHVNNMGNADLQFGAWDQPTAGGGTAESSVGGFSFGAPPPVTHSGNSKPYQSPASQLANSEGAAALVAASDKGLSNKPSTNMSELVDTLNVSQNAELYHNTNASPAPIQTKGDYTGHPRDMHSTPAQISADSLAYANNPPEHKTSHFPQAVNSLNESPESMSSKHHQSTYSNSSGYASNNSSYGSSHYSQQNTNGPMAAVSTSSYTHQSPSAGSGSQSSNAASRSGHYQSFHNSSTSQSSQSSLYGQPQQPSGAISSSSYSASNSFNAGVSVSSSSYPSQTQQLSNSMNSGSSYQSHHPSQQQQPVQYSNTQQGSVSTSVHSSSANSNNATNSYTSANTYQDHQSAGGVTVPGGSNTNNTYGTKPPAGSGVGVYHHEHNGSDTTGAFGSQQATATPSNNTYDAQNAYNAQQQSYTANQQHSVGKITDNLSKMGVKDVTQHSYESPASTNSNVPVASLSLTTSTTTTSTVSSIMATTVSSVSTTTSSAANLLSVTSATPAISSSSTSMSSSKNAPFSTSNKAAPNIPPGVPSVLPSQFLISQPAVPVFSPQAYYDYDVMMQQRVVPAQYYDAMQMQMSIPTTIGNRDQNNLPTSPYSDTSSQKTLADHATVAGGAAAVSSYMPVGGMAGQSSVTAAAAAAGQQTVPPPLPPVGPPTAGPAGALDRTAINLSSFISSKVGSVVYKSGTSNQPRGGDSSKVNRVDAQSPVQQAIQQQLQQAAQQTPSAGQGSVQSGSSPATQSQQFINPAAAASGIPPGYNGYYIHPTGGLLHGGYIPAAAVHIPVPTVPSVTNAQSHGTGTSQLQKPTAGYNTHSYGGNSGFTDLSDEYNKVYGSASKNTVAGTNSDVSSSAYGKSHGQLGSSGTGNSVGAHNTAHFNTPYMGAMMAAAAVPPQHNMMQGYHIQDSTGQSARSAQPGTAQQKTDNRKYSSTGYWGLN